MADKNLNVRLKQKFDTYANWIKIWDSFVPLKGEVIVFEIPSSDTTNSTQTVGSLGKPQHITKTGDGETNLHTLPWDSALAADVYAWAKESALPIAVSDDNIVNLETSTSGNTTTIKASHAQKGQVYQSSNTNTDISVLSPTFKLPQITVDRFGHVVAAEDKEITVSMPELSDLSTLTFDGVDSAGQAEQVVYQPSARHITVEAGDNVEIILDADNGKATITATDTTYGAATATQSGLLTPGDKNKVDKITVDANNNASIFAAEAYINDENQYVNIQGEFDALWGELDSKLAANDAMVFKGTVASNSDLPAKHSVGDTYKVITAGTYAGVKCEVGDMIICITEGTAANNAHWTVVQTNVDGVVTGPASSTDAHIATFDGTSGKVIKDSGFTIGTSVPANAVFTDNNTTYDLAANASATNGNVKLNLTAGGSGSGTDSVTIKGTGTTKVTTDANGVITINSTDSKTGTVTSVSADTGLKITGTATTTPKVAFDDSVVFILDGGSSTVNV